MSLEISKEIVEQIRDHGRGAYPQECCGLLLGCVTSARRSVMGLRRLENARRDAPQNRYLIAPSDLLAAEKEATRLSLDIIGVYHSHPDHPARPSEYDREHAFPWYSYVILSVAAGEPQDLTSWVLQDDGTAFEVEELVVRQEERQVTEVQGDAPKSAARIGRSEVRSRGDCR